MFWKYNSVFKLRELEDKNILNEEKELLRKRAAMEPTHTTKHGVKMILKGIFFAITLTGFEYALQNLEVSGYGRIALQVGFFISLVGLFYVPYGLSTLIKNFMKN